LEQYVVDQHLSRLVTIRLLVVVAADGEGMISRRQRAEAGLEKLSVRDHSGSTVAIPTDLGHIVVAPFTVENAVNAHQGLAALIGLTVW
jgi:hypothetical protein